MTIEKNFSPPVKPALYSIQNLKVQRGANTVLQVDSLGIHTGETLAVIGPNGAGKSTLLLALAGLLQYQHGSILYQGASIHSLDDLKYRREIALVLQEPLLLDRSLKENVAIGLRFRGMAKDAVHKKVTAWLEKLGISHLADRRARTLSGGEAQRACLARALALEPKLLLLDEPFSSLDTPTRQNLIEDLHILLAKTPVTTIFVTHDQDEALLLGDRVAVLLDGKLHQAGTPQDVFGSPVNEQVAAFVGVETVLPGRVTSTVNGQVLVNVDGLRFYAVGPGKPGQAVLVCLRPEDITLWHHGDLPISSARNQLKGEVIAMSRRGPLVRVVVEVKADCSVVDPDSEGFNDSTPHNYHIHHLGSSRYTQASHSGPVRLVALVTHPSVESLGLAPGASITVTFKASAVHLIGR